MLRSAGPLRWGGTGDCSHCCSASYCSGKSTSGAVVATSMIPRTQQEGGVEVRRRASAYPLLHQRGEAEGDILHSRSGPGRGCPPGPVIAAPGFAAAGIGAIPQHTGRPPRGCENMPALRSAERAVSSRSFYFPWRCHYRPSDGEVKQPDWSITPLRSVLKKRRRGYDSTAATPRPCCIASYNEQTSARRDFVDISGKMTFLTIFLPCMYPLRKNRSHPLCPPAPHITNQEVFSSSFNSFFSLYKVCRIRTYYNILPRRLHTTKGPPLQIF